MGRSSCSLFLILITCSYVSSQQQQQQPGIANILQALLANNAAAAEGPQAPGQASNLAELFSYLNETGNLTGVVGALSTNQQVSSLTTSLGTLLFESLSLTVLTNNRVSDACQTDMIIYIEELSRGTQWALKMIDATGKPGSDLADGQMKFIGSYEECVAIRAVSYTSGVDGSSRIRGSFDGRYCSAIFAIPDIPTYILQYGAGYVNLGVCVPNTCTPTDVQIIVSIVERAIFNRSVPYPPTVRCQDTETDVGVDVFVTIGILSIIGCFIFVGTLYDILVVQNTKSIHTQNIYEVVQIQKTANGMQLAISDNGKTVVSNDNDIEVKTSHDPKVMDGARDDHAIKDHVQQTGTFTRLLLSFSLYTNAIKTLSTDQTGSLTAINGVRVITIGWVVLGHTYYYGKQYDANLLQFVTRVLNYWPTMVIAYSDMAVDAFFALSGLLVAYISLKKLKKVGGPRRFNWILFYVHRFLRITPLYMTVLMLATVLLPRLFHGPLWKKEAIVSTLQGCRETWWANLLYVHTYLYAGTPDFCMGWTWYLSADMHMYLVSPLLIVPLFINAIFGLVVCIAVLIGITIANGILTYNGNYPAQPLLIQYLNVDINGYYKEIYNPSHMRFGPYVVGILAGYLLYRWNCTAKISKAFSSAFELFELVFGINEWSADRANLDAFDLDECSFHDVVNLLGWFLTVSLSLVIIYVRFSDEDGNIFSRLDSAIFTALHRVVWSFCPCWVIFSCATGHGGWINRLLSWGPFVLLGRLTFCVYLIHPLVMSTFYASRMVTTYYTDFEAIYLFLAHTTLSFGMSFVLHLAFELPVVGVEKTLLGRFSK